MWAPPGLTLGEEVTGSGKDSWRGVWGQITEQPPRRVLSEGGPGAPAQQTWPACALEGPSLSLPSLLLSFIFPGFCHQGRSLWRRLSVNTEFGGRRFPGPTESGAGGVARRGLEGLGELSAPAFSPSPPTS